MTLPFGFAPYDPTFVTPSLVLVPDTIIQTPTMEGGEVFSAAVANAGNAPSIEAQITAMPLLMGVVMGASLEWRREVLGGETGRRVAAGRRSCAGGYTCAESPACRAKKATCTILYF